MNEQHETHLTVLRYLVKWCEAAMADGMDKNPDIPWIIIRDIGRLHSDISEYFKAL